MFRVEIPTLGGNTASKISFLAKAASLPASTMGVVEVPYRGRKLKVAGDRTFDNWTVTILNDTDFAIRNALEEWQEEIGRARGNIAKSSRLADYMKDMDVYQLDRTGDTDVGTVIKHYRFVSAWPATISAIDLSFDSVDSVEEFTVDFAYQFWTSESSNITE